MSSDPKYRGKLPFDIVETCVTTGYNENVVNSVNQNIEIINLHTDEYGGLENSPLQGPFTQQWVGGHQHRHTPLNSGSDNEQNRAEAFLIDLSPNKVKIYGPNHFDPLRPRAIYSRDNLAKSPLNIKNIKTENGLIGNFSKNYEVVQTSGRNINQSLIENNLTASGVLTTKFITGLTDYTLPENQNIGKSVFVERFSAPGDRKESSRGSLDRNGEEYSPNNSLTTRNIKVRQNLYSQLTEHAEQFSGSIHGVNRNSLFKIEQSGSNFITASNTDNFWIQHPIPATDLRYKWIADSNTNTDLDSLIQYQNYGGNYNKNSAFTDITFNTSSFVVSGSDKQFEIDNAGLRSIVKNKKDINLTTNLFSITDPGLSSSFSEIVNTPYGFSSWKQTRITEHPITIKLKYNNIISIESNKTLTVNNSTLISRRSNNVLNFTEASVTNKFKPIEEVLLLKGSQQPYKFTFTHTNNKSTFANKEISNRLGLVEDSQQMYDMFLKYSTDEFISTNPQNPLSSLEQLKYSETIYPREVNTYLAETRGRTAYILTQSGFDRDGYDRQLGTQRVFWRDNLEDRQRSILDNDAGAYNSMNYLAIKPKAYPSLNYLNVTADGFGSDPNVTASFIQLKYTDLFRDSVLSIDNNMDNENIKISNSLKLIKQYYGRLLPSGPPQINIQRTSSLLINEIDNGNNGELNKEIFLDYYCNNFYTSSDSPEPVTQETQTTNLVRVTNRSFLTEYKELILDSGIYNIPPNYYNFITESFYNTYANIPYPKPSYTAFLGGFESGSRNHSYTNIENFSTYQFYKNKPTGQVVSTLDSGLKQSLSDYTDKKPWFDSYEEYSEDIKRFAKDHSILSEFNMSKNIKFYILENGGNFRISNKKFLTLDGTVQRDSGNNSFLYNNEFNKFYVLSDSNNEIEIIQSENFNILKLEQINFKISGIKKLLPYNGFYPKERTIQLANLFNDYLNNNVSGGFLNLNIQNLTGGSLKFYDVKLAVNLSQSSDFFYKNAALPYFFAPGILYNTIKSGISVDFPACKINNDFISNISDANYFTNNFTNYTSSLGVASILQDSIISSRIPFESIIFPEYFIKSNNLLSSSFEQLFRKSSLSVITPEQKKEHLEKSLNIIKDCILDIKIDCLQNPEESLYSYNFSSPLGLSLPELRRQYNIPFIFLKSDSVRDPNYSLAMSNFLAEIPSFFLKQYDNNQHLNVFRSSELGKWKNFDKNKKYYFDLIMKKSKDLVLIESYKSQYHVTGNTDIESNFNGRYFGWPVNKLNSSKERTENDNLLLHNDPAYAPFTPPYFEGEAKLRFELSASVSNYDSIEQFFNDIKLVDIYDKLGNIIDTDSVAYLNKMSIQDCLEVFGIGMNGETTVSPDGSTSQITNRIEKSRQYWCIHPKLETPVLDFSEQQFIENTGSYWISSGYGRGIWSGYGKIPTGSKAITVELAESFPLQNSLRTNRDFVNATGSLLKQVGFKAETKKIGQLAETKQISEAIVAIPFVDAPIQGKTVYIDGHHFFAINAFIFDDQKTRIELNTVENETSITNMIRLMKQYVIPPNFDFLTYYKNPRITQTNSQNIDPFVMYIFEFKHTLDQQDLADIWQGVMPKIAITAEKDEITFSHKTGQNELFGENFTLPPNMRWMIFKIKKKAEWNYFAITENTTDDNKFKFKFINSEEAKTPEYSYNWPYDYFSLVELAKVDISYTFTKGQTTTNTAIQQPNNPGFAVIGPQQPQQNTTTNNQFSVGTNPSSNVIGVEPVNKSISKRARTTNVSSVRKPTIAR